MSCLAMHSNRDDLLNNEFYLGCILSCKINTANLNLFSLFLWLALLDVALAEDLLLLQKQRLLHP